SELLEGGRVENESKQRQYLHVITTEAARLTRLINNVLDFARIKRDEKPYHFCRTDIVQVAQETLDTFRPQLEATGFVVEMQTPEGPLDVWGDRDAIGQVLLNLLSNAEKYSLDRKEVRLVITAGKTEVQIVVEDRGRGVPRGCEERIFEQFFRA